MRLDEIDFQVTLRCNLSCGFCSVRANEYRPSELPLERILALVDEAARMGLKQLHLTGGEPTLREDLEEILARATSLGVKTRVITNGTLLDRQRLRSLQAAGLRNIMISVDGLAPLHDQLRGSQGSWHKAMNCVQESLALGLTTRIAAVGFQQNLADIPSLMREGARLGVDIFSLFLGSPLGRGSDWQDRVIPPQRWRDFLVQLQGEVAAGEYGPRMRIIAEQGFCWPESEGYDRGSLQGRGAGCATLPDAFDYLMVRGDGELFQCVFFMHEAPSLGNVGRRPLAEILEQARATRPYQRFAEAPVACGGCSRVQECSGGCRGYARLYTGNWHRPDPRCQDQGASFHPVCPIAKLNLRSGRVAGSSEHALATGQGE